jgi:alpha-glucoside transport system substrate-binding protein
MVSDLVAASDDALDDDPELALLLAMQSVRETVDLGFATEEAVDAVHFALQEMGFQYDVDPATPVAVRSGPLGPVGVYAMPPNELMEAARTAVQRTLTDAECQASLGAQCPAEIEIPDNLPLRSGLDLYGATAPGPQALAGTSVTLPANALGDDLAVLAQLLEFTKRTGITVEFAPEEVEPLLGPASPNRRPDVAVYGGPIPAWAEPRAIDIAEFVDPGSLRSDFGDYLLTVGTTGGLGGEFAPGTRAPAIPLDLGLKGLVYYPAVKFREAGYEVPTTWDELVTLSHQIVADGRSPWCFAFASGPGSGWPGTDFIESLVLRTGGVEVYDAWTTGEIEFTSPPVMEAGRIADDLIFEPGFVRDGPESISYNWYDSQLGEMFPGDDVTTDIEPACWLYHQSDYVLGDVPGHAGEVDFFTLPPIDPSQPAPAIATATFATAVVDRPEVRAFMEFVASPEWGEIWATDPDSGFISPNRRFDASAYGDASVDPAVALRNKMATVAEAALDSGLLRFDASDLMPPEIGSGTDTEAGAFWTGMLDWVDRVRSIEQVFADIDAEWAALRADEQAGSTDEVRR